MASIIGDNTKPLFHYLWEISEKLDDCHEGMDGNQERLMGIQGRLELLAGVNIWY